MPASAKVMLSIFSALSAPNSSTRPLILEIRQEKCNLLNFVQNKRTPNLEDRWPKMRLPETLRIVKIAQTMWLEAKMIMMTSYTKIAQTSPNNMIAERIERPMGNIHGEYKATSWTKKEFKAMLVKQKAYGTFKAGILQNIHLSCKNNRKMLLFIGTQPRYDPIKFNKIEPCGRSQVSHWTTRPH